MQKNLKPTKRYNAQKDKETKLNERKEIRLKRKLF